MERDKTSKDRPSPDSPRLLMDCFEKTATTVLVIDGQRWTRAGLAAGAEELAAGLAASGVRPGDRVALHLHNGPEIVLGYLACFRIGAIAAPLYGHYKPAELEALIRRLRPALYLGHADLYRNVAPIGTEVLAANARFVVDDPEHGSARNWAELRSPTSPMPGHEVDPDAPAVLLATSGTTGEPKLVAHSQAAFAAFAAMAPYRQIHPGQVIAFSLSLAHMPGLMHLVACLHNDATLVVVDPANPDGILNTVEAERCTYMTAVSPIYAQLVEAQRARPRDVGSLTFCVCVADVCAAGLQDAFEAVFAVPLRSQWASTEAGGSLVYGLQRGAVSRIVPGTEIRLVAADRQPVAPGETGEMLLRSPCVALGYWTGPGAWGGFTEGWLPTGDLMRQDADGNLWFEGRVKDIIVHAGDNVSPVEVEMVLAAHPAVHDAGVVGVADPVVGQRVIGVVQLADGAGAERLEEIRRAAASQLTDFKVPEQLVAASAIPRNPAGKIDRKQLLLLVQGSRHVQADANGG